MCVPLQEVDVGKPLGVSLHAVSNGAAPPPAVLPAAAVLPAYSTLPLMPGFLGAPHPPAVTPSAVTHTAATDWNTYYYVSREYSSSYDTIFWDVSSERTRAHVIRGTLRAALVVDTWYLFDMRVSD